MRHPIDLKMGLARGLSARLMRFRQGAERCRLSREDVLRLARRRLPPDSTLMTHPW